jgi:hypothetical protein
VSQLFVLGSVKYLATAGAYSVTYFETVGWNGIIDADASTTALRPAGFPSQPGAKFPVYHLLASLGEFAGGTVRLIDSSDSLTGKPLVPSLRGMGAPVNFRLLSGESQTASLPLPVQLPAYGIARIDLPVD